MYNMEKTTEQREQECREDLKEIAHFYGGFDKLIEVIGELRDAEMEAAWERHVTRDL